MARILLLGGTGEALKLAHTIGGWGHDLTYSLAGLGRVPCGPFRVRTGGFGGAVGLACYLTRQGVELMIDATHPYAGTISVHCAEAARTSAVPFWALRRRPWSTTPGDRWHEVAGWDDLVVALAPFRRPFFTVGREPLSKAHLASAKQFWVVRCLHSTEAAPNMMTISARGPFEFEAELDLMQRLRIDVLVSKNSGGTAVEAKLLAARQCKLPVLMMARPKLPDADRAFGSISTLLEALSS